MAMAHHPLPAPAASDAAVVAKAAVRAADRLGLTNKVLAQIIGVSEPSASRLRQGKYPLDKNQKPFELAVLFIRLYRSLDAVVAGDDGVAKAWLRNNNTALNAAPIDLIRTISGLTDVIHYLDSRRAVG